MPANTIVIPLKAIYTSGNVTALGELNSGDKLSSDFLNLSAYVANTAFQSFVANTNAYIADVAVNAGEVSNSYLTSTYTTNTVFQSALANTNVYIATKLDSSSYTTADVQSKAALANTNAYIASVSATERSALANTNAYIATKLDSSSYTTADVQSKAALANTNTRIDLINTNLTSTNTALRTLISDRLQLANAESLYVSLSGDTMTGTLTLSGAPSADLHAATKKYVDDEVAGLVDTAPSTLDTLNELAAALGDNPNFATTVTTNLGQKLGATASITLTGDVTGSGSFSSNAVSIALTDTNLSNTNSYIASQSDRIDLVNTNLTGTNTAIRTLVSDRLQVANAAATYTTISTFNSALANTNSYIATKLDSSSYTTADVQSKAALANTNAYIATKLADITGESIKDLSDVYSSMTPSDGQVLTYDTTNGWQAENASGGIALTDLSVTTNAVGTAALSYNNTTGAFTYTPPDLTSYVTSLSDLSVTSTAAELNLLDGVTATTAELNYVDGVTSAIQTQLDSKAATAGPTFTGTVTIPTLSIGGNFTLPTTDGTTGQVIVTNGSGTLSWAAQSGGGASALTDLSDVYSSMSPTDGQVLTYDTTNGWQAEDASGGGGGVTESTVNDIVDGKIQVLDIGDVVGSDGSPGQVLESNGDGTASWNTASGITTGKAIAMSIVFGG